MKKITVLLMLMVASVSFGQLKRVELAPSEKSVDVGMFKFGGKLYYNTTKKGDVYTFEYRDTDFKMIDTYRSFELVETGNDFETLYAMIKEGLETLPTEPVILDMKDYVVALMFDKPYKVPAVRFSSKRKNSSDPITYSEWMLPKHVDKVFGKEEDKKKKK